MSHKRESTSLEKWAFFGKSIHLSAIIDPKRWFHWKSLNPNNQPLTTAPWDQLTTLPTVVNFFLLLVLTTTLNSSSNNNCRSDYYRHSSSMNVHIRSDKSAHKQSAPKTLRLRHSPITKGKFHLIQLWCRFVAHLHGVFTDIAHYCRAQ